MYTQLKFKFMPNETLIFIGKNSIQHNVGVKYIDVINSTAFEHQ